MQPYEAADWQDVGARNLRTRFWAFRHSQSLPLSEEFLTAVENTDPNSDISPDTGSFSDHFEVVDLTPGPESWLKLHRRFTAGSQRNAAPWNRCLSILAGHGARTCVIEHYYVCLDFKSEVVAFHSQLDYPRTVIAIRLHFFSDVLDRTRLFNLQEEAAKGYLGYIVCRTGGAPLVGRTNIKPPDYVKNCVKVTEGVHFLGQRLEIAGMPFMQQDEQFDACAQVAVWAIHYGAFRLGLVQRRLVADIVAISGVAEPMKPRVSDGLMLEDAARLIRTIGLGAKTHTVASVDYDTQIARYSVLDADRLIDELEPLFAKTDAAKQVEPIRGIDAARIAAQAVDALANSEELDSAAGEKAVELLDRVIFHLVQPYIRSKFAAYASTVDHAIVICGLDYQARRTIFFVHDDQYGPYLAMDSLIRGCQDDLMRQGYRSANYPKIAKAGDPDGLSFPDDATAALVKQSICFGDRESRDKVREVDAIIVAGPPRLVLQPSEAELDCMNFLWESADQASGTGSLTPPMPWSPRTSFLMGIDYKQQRREQLVEQDPQAAYFFSALHLSEWVVVVEDGSGPEGGGASQWEFVYDGSSVGGPPVIQMARIGTRLVASHPLSSNAQSATLTAKALPWVRSPDKVGKI